MNTFHEQQGQSLIEILFAVALFTVGVVTIGYLVFDAFSSVRYGDEYTQARLLAAEGIEATRSIRDADFSVLAAGTYGIALSGGVWTLVPTSDTEGIFTRSVTLSDRDGDMKNISSTVLWDGPGGTTRSVTLESVLSNWMHSGGEAASLEVRTVYAELQASSTEVTGIEMNNVSDSSLTLSSLTIDWEGPALLSGVSIDGSEVFSASSSPVSSGADIDVGTYVLNPYSGFRMIDYIRFDRDVSDYHFVVTFNLSDGTHRYVYVAP